MSHRGGSDAKDEAHGYENGSPRSDNSYEEGDRKTVTYLSRSLSKERSYSRSPSTSKSKKKSARSRSRSGSRRKSRKSSRSHRSRSRSPRKYSRSSRYSRSRSDSRSGSDSPRWHRSHSRSPLSNRKRHKGCRDNPNPNRCVGVFGLSLCTTEEHLRRLFTKYGPVDSVQIIYDAKTGRSRGFGFVYFQNYEDARVAKEVCSGMEIDGREIRVDFSITERAHTPTPGIYMGKPTYHDDHHRRGNDYYGSSSRSRYRSPSPYYSSRRRSRYDRSRSRSYSPRRY
ncbi:Hypothetical protein NTJ_09072 [Nesidiocoris tenuis]|uniref:RRM domain-containing protein n=1 Tax=Nesidiocoris tenuis TaxID=355587 RepID=A0ABN7AWE6_9HEMI|nr:Hypothetical protein NTJ_09072 [Nesidiocoris tenuis]